MKPYANNGGKPIFNEGISPVGTIVHLYHDKPQLKTSDQYGKVPDIDPDTGVQKAEYKGTLAWHKSRIGELQQMIADASKTQEEGWPGSSAPGAHFFLQPFFRDGDNPEHNTENRDYLKGKYYLNFKKKAKIEARDKTQPVGPNNFVYTGAPGLLGPYGPEDKIMYSDIWPGCTGRISYTMFATEYMGKHFISVRMQNVQKYDEGDGTRIGGGGTPAAEKQFGALKEGAPPAGNMFGGQQPQQGANLFGGAQQQQGGMFGGQPQQGGFPGQGGQQNPFGGGSAFPQGGGASAPAQNLFGAPQSSPSNGGFGSPHRML